MAMEPGNYIAHNHFSDLSRNGIFAFRNQGGNVVEFNEIHDCMQTTIDGAAIHFATMNRLAAPNFIMNNYLPDLESNLYSIHSNAYESAYESEMYNNIFNALQEYVDGYGEYYSVPHRFKKDTMTQRFRIPVASNFNSNVLDYLDSGKGWGTRGLLEYWGSYIKLIADDFDCLKVDAPDYPDYSKVDEYMNEIFTDYI
jgi:hypothetical protein